MNNIVAFESALKDPVTLEKFQYCEKSGQYIEKVEGTSTSSELNKINDNLKFWLAGIAFNQSQIPFRSDIEIINQTIAVVDVISGTQRFQRTFDAPFPWESESGRGKEWWEAACRIQEIITNTDPENCDFEEYMASGEYAKTLNQNIHESTHTKGTVLNLKHMFLVDSLKEYLVGSEWVILKGIKTVKTSTNQRIIVAPLDSKDGAIKPIAVDLSVEDIRQKFTPANRRIKVPQNVSFELKSLAYQWNDIIRNNDNI